MPAGSGTSRAAKINPPAFMLSSSAVCISAPCVGRHPEITHTPMAHSRNPSARRSECASAAVKSGRLFKIASCRGACPNTLHQRPSYIQTSATEVRMSRGLGIVVSLTFYGDDQFHDPFSHGAQYGQSDQLQAVHQQRKTLLLQDSGAALPGRTIVDPE